MKNQLELAEPHYSLRDWSLITGEGGRATKWYGGGGQVKFYPMKSGDRKVLNMLKF